MKDYYITEIILYQFRTYNQFIFKPNQGFNLIKGRNMAGKSNLLESIYFSSILKSFRTSNTRFLIECGKDGFRIELSINDNNKTDKLIIVRNSKNETECSINKRKVMPSSIIGFFNSIIFSRDDINIIQEGPRLRRKWLDILLCRLDPLYLDTLKRYKKVLTQRNALLRLIKEGRAAINGLDPWNKEIEIYSQSLTEKRKNYIIKISRSIEEIYLSLSGNKDKVKIIYKPNIEGNQKPDIKNEIERGRTLFGPHLDEILLLNNGYMLRYYGSEGQKRTLSLALRLTERVFLRDKKEREPVLLFDDTFGELDIYRREKLLEYISTANQVFITSTQFDKDIYKNLKCTLWNHNGEDIIMEKE